MQSSQPAARKPARSRTPDVKRIYWNLPDPKHLPIEQVRPLRDEIQACVEQLIAQLDNEARAA